MEDRSLSYKEISKQMGIGIHHIQSYISSNRDKYPKRVIEIDSAEFKKLWDEDLSGTNIAKKLNVSRAWIYRYIKNHNYPSRFVDVKKFAEYWQKGFSCSEIAEKFGISKKYVYKYANMHRDICPPRRRR